MAPFSNDELQMFADEMSDGDFAELLLIDMHMSRQAEPLSLDPETLKRARAATTAAATLLNVNVDPESNCIEVDFASRRLLG